VSEIWGVAIAAGVGAVGSIVAGGEQASGQEAAANTQAGMFNTIVGQEQPYLTAGNSAETSLSQLLGTAPATGAGGTATGTSLPGGYLTQTFQPTMEQLAATPGYQFALQQGDQATENANTPGVGALSGPALKSLMSFNQGLASTQYQNSFNNFQSQQNNIFSRLSSIAGLGQNAAGNLGNQGAQLGTGIAQAQAAATGSIAGGISGATNNVGQSILLSQLLNNPSSAGTWNGGTPFANSNGTLNYDPGPGVGLMGGS
jgi:hypothetical protein